MSPIPTISSISNILESPQSCVEFLIEQEILYKQPRCSKCRAKTSLRGTRWRCSKRDCSWSKSVFVDSVFASSRLEPNEILRLGYLWVVDCSRKSVVTMTGHSTATVTSFFALFREMASTELREARTQIGGQGVIVEVDESKFGKRKYHRGKPVDGAWVVGGVERTNERRFFAVVVKTRDEATIKQVLAEHVLPGSVILTDMWRAYKGAAKSLKLDHGTVNHSKHFKDPETGVHTSHIEGTWHGMKIAIPEKNRKRGILENHISEFIWRRENQDRLWLAFLDTLRNTLVT